MPKRGEPPFHLIGATMADLCKVLSVPEMMDRAVIDRTGIAGMFDIRIPGPGDMHRGVPDGGMHRFSDPASPVTPADPSSSSFDVVQAAIQKLGLKIEPAKGSGKFFVIDHVERPSEN
jgi:uncharacterized protein (TIGR03435 family)